MNISAGKLAILAAWAIGLFAAPARAASGDLDESFGMGGKVITDFGPGANSAYAVAIQGGKLIAAGRSGSNDFALARYNADGSLDASFGSMGMVTTDIGVFDEAFAVAIQTDGKIVAAGGSGSNQFVLVRYNVDGSLDTSFDGDGRTTTVFSGTARAFGVVVQPDGRIVATGDTDGLFDTDFALARYNADGSLDTSFGSGGKLTTDFGGFETAAGLAIQPDRRIVVAGSGGTVFDFLLARYEVDGSLDTSFGSGGKVATDFGGFDGAAALALQADGKIVAAGRGGFFTRFALARYDSDGTLDATFDGDGMVTTEFFGENIESAMGLAMENTGKVVVVGFAFKDFDPSFALARYNTDGSLDPSFGDGGKVTTDFGDPNDVGVLCPPGRKDCSEDFAMDVAVQLDGKIVAVGGAGPCIPSCGFALARYQGESPATEVTIDIRPGSWTNPINLPGRGRVAVAVIASESFDAATVDPSTVCFGDSDDPSRRDCTEAHGKGHLEDVNGDGRTDLVLHYEVVQTGIEPGDTSACLTGTTLESIAIRGCDSIMTH